jgi:hypothetical protein
MRLDEAKLGELGHWAHALREAGDEGSRASGRAILMLIEELERLHLELLRAREQLGRLGPESNADFDAGPEDTVALALHARLHRVGQNADQDVAAQPTPPGVANPNAAPDGDTTSARSWIETLRRQK